MAITIVSHSELGTYAGQPGPDYQIVTVQVPTGVQDGDLLVMFCSGYGSYAFQRETPSGWIALDCQDIQANSSYGSSAIYFRVAANEPASYRVHTEGGEHAIAMVAFRGASTIGAWAATTGYTDRNAPSINTTSANAMVWRVAMHVAWGNHFSWPGDQTELFDVNFEDTIGMAGGASCASVGGAYKLQAVPGATGIAQVSLASYFQNKIRVYTLEILPQVLGHVYVHQIIEV